MIEITLEQIEQGIDAADLDTVELLQKIKTFNEMKSSALKAGLTDIDYQIIVEKTKYFLLGLISIVNLIEEIGDSISTEGDGVDTFISQFLEYILLGPGQAERLLSLEINRSPESITVINEIVKSAHAEAGAQGNVSTHAATSNINSNERHIESEDLSASHILSGIENPAPTVAERDFALPKMKPSTTDILRNLDITPPPPKEIIDTAPITIKPQIRAQTIPAQAPMPAQSPQQSELDININTDGIIDPFKGGMIPQPMTTSANTNAVMPLSTMTLPPQSAPSPAPIQDRMDNKLSSVTSTQPKESFGVINSSTKRQFNDPYREPIE